MRRRGIHFSFAVLALLLAVFALSQWMVVQQSKNAMLAIKEANALSAGAEFERAEAAFDALIRLHGLDAIGLTARFNLANAYLRQGMRGDLDARQKTPMLELAKQRYRDLLRITPNDWDARYNLERTLQLAPKYAALADDNGDPIKSVRVIVPDFKAKDLP